MHRRDLLKSMLGAGALYTAGGLPIFGSNARASDFAGLDQRVLMNVFLDGAPDFRYLLPPAFSSDSSRFGYHYWHSMADVHETEDSNAALQSRWENDYTPLSHSGTDFGMLASCSWLHEMWLAGNVAIVSNVLGSDARDHNLARLVMDQGDRSTRQTRTRRPGWGGRLAAAAGGNVVAVTRIPRRFGYGPHPDDPEDHDNTGLIAARDLRGLRLYEGEVADRSKRGSMARSLKAYYAAKRAEMPRDSAYWRFMEHERKLRELGEPLQARFDAVPIPADLFKLTDPAQSSMADPEFGLQLRNTYDALAASDMLNPRVLSLAYDGFDTHDRQRAELEPRFRDLFAREGGLATLWASLPAGTRSNLVMLVGGEFGRQIRSNGDGGTDHGEGNVMLVIGESVQGGVYGDLFPQEEIGRLEDPSPQIIGQTGIERLFARVADWVQPGAGSVALPGVAQAPVEAGVDLAGLFA